MDLADGFTCTCTFRGVCWCSCKCIDVCVCVCVYLIFGRPWKHLLNAKNWGIQCLQEWICYFSCKSCKMKWRLTVIHIEEVLQLRKTDKPSWTMDSSAKQVEIWYLTVTEYWNTNNNVYKFQEIPFFFFFLIQHQSIIFSQTVCTGCFFSFFIDDLIVRIPSSPRAGPLLSNQRWCSRLLAHCQHWHPLSCLNACNVLMMLW